MQMKMKGMTMDDLCQSVMPSYRVPKTPPMRTSTNRYR
jgi:hypothetical protein